MVYGWGMSSDADPTPIADGTSEPSSQEVVQSFIAALERLDFDGALALAAPDIQWINVPWKTATNKERFEKMLLGQPFHLQTRRDSGREFGQPVIEKWETTFHGVRHGHPVALR